MKTISLLCILCILSFSVFGQSDYSKVRIFVPDYRLTELSDLGIPIDHGIRKKDTWLDTDLSQSQIQSLIAHQFDYEILIEDVTSFYIDRNSQPQAESDRAACDGNSTTTGFNPQTPANFSLGSFAGFYTYQEFLDELDAMAAAYPNLITTRAAIDTFQTHEGRSIYWVRISDNPNVDENENEVLYTAIHHAREPAGLSQLIFYMWYILENYGSDDEITYLLDNTELYFIPMINPDGYIENETNSPNGGGMHRKNKRNVGTTNPGVDLNRNYSYHWNESGTTSDPDGDTYPGTHSFSEPETQAVKYFCENRDFEFALNAHSYSNLLLFPIGYASAVFAQDHSYFQTFSNHQVLFNDYIAQKASDLYPAAGDSDDWMYADDLSTKPKIYALTPEIGSSADGFWPAQNRILPLCKENVWMNLIQAHLPHIYGVTKDLDPNRLENLSGYFHYNYERLGLENGPVSIEILPLQGIQTIGSANSHTVNLMDIIEDSISYTLSSTLSFGDEIKYILKTDFGLWARHDTIVKQYGNGSISFIDNANNLVNWNGNWGLTNEYFVSPDFSISDSPFGNYSNNTLSEYFLDNNSITFENATYAYAQFHARWEIENDYDYVEFMISTDDGVSWTPLCGQYTNPGTTNQDNDQPLYDGTQTDWVLEEVDLSDYLNIQNPQFKFKLVSDQFVNEDGFAFDDFKIITDGYPLGLSKTLNPNSISVYPNPARSELFLVSNGNVEQVEIYNHVGQLKGRFPVLNNKETINVEGYANGIYYIKCIDQTGQFTLKKIAIL